jgi:hypothetical protein
MDRPESFNNYKIALNTVLCYAQNYDNYKHVILYTSQVPDCQHEDVGLQLFS